MVLPGASEKELHDIGDIGFLDRQNLGSETLFVALSNHRLVLVLFLGQLGKPACDIFVVTEEDLGKRSEPLGVGPLHVDRE